jgi:hypothetical protein
LGREIWLIHGTTFGKGDGTEHWSDGFRDKIGEEFGQKVNAPGWGGENSKTSRTAAAEQIAAQIREAHRRNPSEPIRIVGYSHGGNVAIEVINILAREGIHVEMLVTVATPSRSDYRLETDVGQHINVYNQNDGAQILGGIDTCDGFGGVGLGRRHQPGAENIEVRTGVRRWPWGIFGHNHSFMNDDWNTWERYILPTIDGC